MLEKINKFRNAPERTVLTFTFSESIALGKQGNGNSASEQGENSGYQNVQNSVNSSRNGQGGSENSQGAQSTNSRTKSSQEESGGYQSGYGENGTSQASQSMGAASEGGYEGKGGNGGSQSSSPCGCSSCGASGSIQCSHTLKVRLCDAIAVLIGAKIVLCSLMLLKCKLGK